MAIKVHGSVLSIATQRVIACLHEKEVEFEFVTVDMQSGAHKKEPFTSLNPFAQVPAFEDGDLTLFESRAITQYIAREHPSKGTNLLFHDSKKMAIMSVWMEVEAHQFDTVAAKLAWELIFKKMFGQEADTAAVKEHEATLANVLDIYEARLSQSKYLGGDSFSLVDLHHMPILHCLAGTSVKKLFDERPHVSAWRSNILARPAWAKTAAMKKQM
ncbi:hypothetical protein Ancab_021902 [Ancistrocladus abbreviatus]